MIRDKKTRVGVQDLLQQCLLLDRFVRIEFPSEAQLNELQTRAIALQGAMKTVFAATDEHTYSASDFAFIKFHYLVHLKELITRHGAPCSWSLQSTERKHQAAAKRPFEATNHRNWMPQIIDIVQRRNWLETKLPALLGQPLQLHSALAPSKEDDTYLVGKLRRSPLSVADQEMFAKDWEKFFPGEPFSPSKATWYRSARLIRPAAHMDTVVCCDDTVVLLTLSASSGLLEVPNAGNSSTLWIARPQAFFFYDSLSLAVRDSHDEVGADEESRMDAEETGESEPAASAPPGGGSRGKGGEKLERSLCFMVLREYNVSTPTLETVASLTHVRARQLAAPLFIERTSVLYSKTRALPFFQATADDGMAASGVLISAIGLLSRSG